LFCLRPVKTFFDELFLEQAKSIALLLRGELKSAATASLRRIEIGISGSFPL